MDFIIVFVIALVLRTSILFYLSWRQERAAFRHRGEVPQAFASEISLEAHQKAADYTVAKQRFSRKAILVEVAILSVWLFAGGLAWLDATMQPLLGNFVWWHGAVIIGLFFLIGMILSLPMSLYNTFVLEAKFGFNRITPAIFISDLVKGLVLGMLLGGAMVLTILWLMDIFAYGLWWLWVALFVVVFQITMMIAYPRFIAPLFNKFKVLDQADVKERVEHLMKRCGFLAKDVFVMDGSKRSSHGNAYFTGFGKMKRVVFFDTLFKQLNPPQIEAVLAHELGHYALGHIPKLIFITVVKIFIGFWLLDLLLHATWFFNAFNITPSHHGALLLFALVFPVFTGLLSPLNNILSRKYEYQADSYAAQHSKAEHLIAALLALYRDNAATLTPDTLYSSWHDSHPPAALRIGHLESLAIDT